MRIVLPYERGVVRKVSIDTLICTVGTSLLGNIGRLPSDETAMKGKLIINGDACQHAYMASVQKIRKIYDEGRWASLGRALTARVLAILFPDYLIGY